MNFRRVVIALAVLTAFAGLASAQLPVNQNLTCTASAAQSPSIRTEGVAELVGDVLLTCTGGPTQNGGASDLGAVKLVVDFGVPVTSKATAAADAAGNTPIDAILFVDEPGTTASIVGGISVCAFGAACTTAFAAGPPETITGNNSFQAYIPKDKPNQIAFNSVPVLTLGGTSFQHIFRVSNVRVTPTSSPVVATVTATPLATSTIGLLLNPTTATVATPSQGLATSISAPGLSLCNTTDLAGTKGSPNMALLTFAEKFNGAFKSQQIASLTSPPQASVTGSYNTGTAANPKIVTTAMSESGVVVGTAGLADSPTRLKALFTGLDSNVTYYVSLNNVADYKTAPTAANIRAALLPQAANMETQVAGTYAVSALNAWGAVPVVALTVTKGAAEAVWEITNPDYANAESLTFAVYAVYSNIISPPKATTATTVQLGFAPTITSTSTDAANTWVPRFQNPPAAGPFAPVLQCQTSLLFPFVTNQSGFETGIAIANTSQDPFGSTTSTGTCALNFYGANAPSAAVTTAAVAAGSTYAQTVSGLGMVNFQGYMVGVCNFQFAHGFAFVQGAAGAPNSTAMGYLPLVLSNSNRNATLLGEALSQ